MSRLIYLLVITSCYAFPIAAQTLRGGDIKVIKNSSGLNFDFAFNLYFEADADLELNQVVVSYSGVIDTIDLTLQTEPRQGIRKLVFESNHTFPGVPALYQIRLLDVFPLPELTNLDNNPQIITYVDLLSLIHI